jgi:hypothetical protein
LTLPWSTIILVKAPGVNVAVAMKLAVVGRAPVANVTFATVEAATKRNLNMSGNPMVNYQPFLYINGLCEVFVTPPTVSQWAVLPV